MGDDPWPYGVQKNSDVVDTLVGDLYEQGLVTKRVSVQELFAPNTIDLDP